MSTKSMGALAWALALALGALTDLGAQAENPAPAAAPALGAQGVAQAGAPALPAAPSAPASPAPLPPSPQSLIPPLPSSEAGATTVSLEAALAAALSGNDDLTLARANLAAARAAHAANLAKAEPSLSGSASAGLTEGFTDQSMAKSLGASGLGLGQVYSGGLSFAEGTATQSSGTRIGLTATHSVPVSPQTGLSGAASAQPQTTLLSASISQVIWDGYLGGQTKALIDQSLLGLQGKELSARQARSAALAKVKQAYITTLTAQRTLALRLSILDKQRLILAQIQATYALKQASAIDLKTAQINARSAELDVETSRHDFSLARQRLALLIGLAPDADFRVAEIDPPPAPAASLDEAVAKGLANRADIAQAELSRRSAAISLALAQGASQPGLSATGGIGLGINWGAPADPSAGVAKAVDPATGQALSLGLKLSLPILDGGAAKAAEDAAGAQTALATTQASQLRKSVVADIRDAWWNLQILSERSDLAKQSVDLAESQLALTREQLRFGTATNQDLMTAAVAAANAEAAMLAAKSSQMLAELALETAMGL